MAKSGTKGSGGGRSSALDRAEHGGKPVSLSADEKLVLADAVRAGTDLAATIESEVMAYGRLVLSKVFRDDTTAALDQKNKNPVWLELVRRAGGPTLRLGRRALYVCVKLAAWDKRIQDETFDRLDIGRKELLLPLADAKRMRDAANHVVKVKLTQTDTKQYVTSLMEENGKSRQVRLTKAGLASRVGKLSESLSGASVMRQVRQMHADLAVEERNEVADREAARCPGGDRKDVEEGVSGPTANPMAADRERTPCLTVGDEQTRH
ncbi:hypothetical protein BH09MYX1_BH09MYX1_62750 [soil metagenome]